MMRISALAMAVFFSSCSGCSALHNRPSQIMGESATPRFGYILNPPALADCEPRGMETQGKVVLYEFFFSTCRYCMEMEPRMRELAARFAARGLVVISVSSEEWDKMNNLVAHGGNRVLCRDINIFRAWQIDGFPYFVVVDRRGVVTSIVRGGGDGTAERLQGYIEEVL